MTFATLNDTLRGIPQRASETDRAFVTEEMRARQAAQEERTKYLTKDEELDKNLQGQIKARWKIEVTFLSKRSLKKPTAYGLQVWESGRALHGDGDVLAYFCLDSDEGSNEGCRGIIPADAVRGDVAMCPHCNRALNANRITNMTGGNVYMDKLAEHIAEVFRRRCNSNADIYLKYHRSDIRYIAMERDKGTALANRLKGMHIYPLHRILKDISAGADLVGRMKAFITS